MEKAPFDVDFSKIERILVIKLRHHGDVLLSSPVFTALRAAFPEARLDALVYTDTEPMLSGHPCIDKIHLCERSNKKLALPKRLWAEWQALRQIQAERYHLVINLTEGDRGAIACWFSKARYRVGWPPGPKKGLIGKKKLYTHIVKKPGGDRHVVELNLDTVRRIGIHPALSERELTFVVPEEAKKKAEELLGATENFIHLHPTSRWLFKCWPAKSVAELMHILHEKGHALVLTAAPVEKELQMVKEIMSYCRDIPVCNLAGKLGIKELGAVMEKSRFFVGVDSAPMHMASALKKPLVALFGPSSERAWGPWRVPQAEVISLKTGCQPCGLDGCGGGKVSDCLASLPVASVVEAIERVIPSFRQ